MPRPKKGERTPGSGKPKGHKAPQTLEKLEARKQLAEFVFANLMPMARAQVANAIGIGHLYTRDKSGKFNKIEDPEQIDRLLVDGKEGENYWIFTKDPSVQAFSDLLNRALDRPKEQELEVKVTAVKDISDRELASRLALISAALKLQNS